MEAAAHSSPERHLNARAELSIGAGGGPCGVTAARTESRRLDERHGFGSSPE